MRIPTVASALCLIAACASAIDLTVGDLESSKEALSKIAEGLYDYYWGKEHAGIVGMYVPPYYWWEAGAAWNSMLDYWYFTGDTKYNKVLKESLLVQAGSSGAFMPSNQTTTEGNDDQGFWGITAMAAAERNFDNPDDDQLQWLEMAQAVFNTMAARWDTQHCGGGLRWQIYTWNNGYEYKNTVSNGCLLNLASRLYRYTGNETYGKWAEKVWDWVQSVEYLQDDGSLYDGGNIENDCKDHTSILWTYNYGLFMSSSAFMYNATEDTKWSDRAQKLWEHGSLFFKNGIMYEAACQPSNGCNNDQRCFKAIFSRFLGLTAKLIPDMHSSILEKLSSSAEGAAKSCQPGDSGYSCGLDWTAGKFDGKYGMGEQMCAMEVIQNTLIDEKEGPLTNKTGGTSKGNSNAGTSADEKPMEQNVLDITTGDRAGAGVLTVAVMGGVLGVSWWMMR